MIASVIKADYINNFIIDISIKVNDNNCTSIIDKRINLYEYIKKKKEKGIFAPLKDMNYFKTFKLNANTIEWQNGADIAPERFLEL